MATSQSILIDAIRRIAGIDPDTLALLRQIQKRGGIDGIKTQLGGDDGTGAEQSCCGNPGDPPPPPPGGGGGGGGGGGPWTDCATGQPVTFDPNGFPQPETCKDCERPDPTWEEGRYYKTNSGQFPNIYGETVGILVSNLPETFTQDIGGIDVVYTKGEVIYGSSQHTGSVRYDGVGTRPNGSQTYFHYLQPWGGVLCANEYIAAYCDLTEPPMIEDCQDWEPDGATNYTLADGCITASSCDPEASAQAQQCNECITICNSAGEEHVICAGPDDSYLDNGLYGGWSGYY